MHGALYRTWHPAPGSNPGVWQAVVLGAVVVGLVGAGVYIFATRAAAATSVLAPPPTEDDAVDMAIAQLGPQATTSDLAAAAFALSHRGEPISDASWSSVVSKVASKTGRPSIPLKLPSAAVDVGVDADVADWIATLSESQSQALRVVVGPVAFDELASGGHGHSAAAAMNRLKAMTLADFEASEILRNAVGDEAHGDLLDIFDDTASPPSGSPAAPS